MRPVNADALQAVFIVETIMRRAWRRRQAEQPNRTTTTFGGAPVLRRINSQNSAARRAVSSGLAQSCFGWSKGRRAGLRIPARYLETVTREAGGWRSRP